MEPPKITRELVKRFHKDMNQALSNLAEAYNLKYQAKSMRFSSWEITGRFKFIQPQQAAQKGIGIGKFVIGDRVYITGKPKETYVVEDITSRDNVIGSRESDGKRYRLPPAILSKVMK